MLEDYTVIDLEMTGLNVKTDVILEVGAVRIRGGVVVDAFEALLQPNRKLSEQITAITGITQEMAEQGREPEEVMEAFFAFLGEDVLVGQNLIFDYSFLKQWAVNHKMTFERQAVDTLKLARHFLPKEQKKDLESLCTYFEIEREHGHRALEDAKETWKVFEKIKSLYGTKEAEVFQPYPLQYKVKKQTPATERQKKYLSQYATYFGIELPVEIEQLTKSEASRLTDQLIVQYGRMPKH